jgi:hypothetical protein
MHRFQLPRQRLHFRSCLLDRDSRLQPDHCRSDVTRAAVMERAAAGPHGGSHVIGIQTSNTTPTSDPWNSGGATPMIVSSC